MRVLLFFFYSVLNEFKLHTYFETKILILIDKLAMQKMWYEKKNM